MWGEVNMVFEMKCAVICCEKLHSAVIGVDALQYAVIERNALLTASPSIAPECFAGSGESVKGKSLLAASRPCTLSPFFRLFLIAGDGGDSLRRGLRQR